MKYLHYHRSRSLSLILLLTSVCCCSTIAYDVHFASHLGEIASSVSVSIGARCARILYECHYDFGNIRRIGWGREKVKMVFEMILKTHTEEDD